MGGGILNLIAEGTPNNILHGNPTKTFFKAVYSKHTNFGLQKFRVDYEGQKYLQLSESTKLSFKIPKYAELLLDTYLVISLPTIWSALLKDSENNIRSYNFKWIENIGTEMIEEILVHSNGVNIQKFPGNYISTMVERDFSTEKKKLFNEMTGNISELNNPEDVFHNNNNENSYPSAKYNSVNDTPQPSIMGRKLYIPISTWWSFNSKMAFPLVSLEYSDLQIDITLRPIKELFTIIDIDHNSDTSFNRVQPNFSNIYHSFYRFLQPPIDINFNTTKTYENTNTNWNSDIHLISTYCFLSDEESKMFVDKPQQYLFKDVHKHHYKNITGANKVKIETSSLVSNWMFYFQRDDIEKRNEWSNYTNKEFKVSKKYLLDYYTSLPTDLSWNNKIISNNYQPSYTNSFIYSEDEDILINLGILLNGKYRETTMDVGVYNYIEKYNRSKGYCKDGLYVYNFGLNTGHDETQPYNAINLNKFKNIEFEFTTIEPPPKSNDEYMTFKTICDGNGELIGITKNAWDIFQYNYNLTIYEERYNILTFNNGFCELHLSR